MPRSDTRDDAGGVSLRETDSGRVGYLPATIGHWAAEPASVAAALDMLGELAATAILDGDITGNGLMVRTGAGSYTNRSLAVGSGKLTVTDGDGVSGDPTLNFGSVAITDLSDVATKSGTGTVALFQGSPTLTTPTIANLTNATHDHADAAGGGELQIVKDLSPQLGANLDTNEHELLIDDGHGILDENGKAQLLFATTASAVNHIQITNAATGTEEEGPEIAAVGDDTNIALWLRPKGSGFVSLGPSGYDMSWDWQSTLCVF